VATSGKPHHEVARDLGIPQTTLSDWVRQSRRETTGEALSPDERAELRELRRKVRVLEMEREILKKAAAFFAQESDRIR
jgi:transposase